MPVIISSENAEAIRAEDSFRQRPAAQRRIISTLAHLHEALPGETIEAVDLDEIQVTTGGYREVISITEPEDTSGRAHRWQLYGLAWNASGGLDEEVWLAG